MLCPVNRFRCWNYCFCRDDDFSVAGVEELDNSSSQEGLFSNWMPGMEILVTRFVHIIS